MFNFNKFKEKVVSIEDWLHKEMGFIRTGRAIPAILDGVLVEAYGSKMPIRELASVNLEDSKTLRVEPWDKSQLKAIEKGVQSAALGLSVNTDEKGLRIIFPELTGERREQFIKLAKTKLEEAKKSLRSVREETVEEIEEKEKGGGMGEDEKFKLKEDLQKLVDEANKKMDDMLTKKIAEIQN